VSDPERPAASRLEALLRAGHFAVTCELETTDSADPESVYEVADPLRGKVDAVNCTDNSSAHPHVSQVAAAHLLVDRGIEPVAQFACRDRNRLALQADMLGAAALGVRNVMLMTGDDVSAGDHPEARPIWDLDSLHLIRIARVLRHDGTYLSGRPLTEPPRLFIGAVENPFAPPLEYRPIRLQKKVEAGAEFIQTQICFNVPALRRFMDQAGELVPLDKVFVLVGIFIARSLRGARYLRDHVPGIDVPDWVIERMEAAPAARQADEGRRIALEVLHEARQVPGVSGVHLMSIGGLQDIIAVIEEAGLLPRPPVAAPATAQDLHPPAV